MSNRDPFANMNSALISSGLKEIKQATRQRCRNLDNELLADVERRRREAGLDDDDSEDEANAFLSLQLSQANSSGNDLMADALQRRKEHLALAKKAQAAQYVPDHQK